MPDCFVSYTAADESWAEWIAFVLEAEGFSTILQKWDFKPGSNFVLEMQKAASTADRTLIVLSPAYLTSGYGAPEWAAALARDPQGNERRLVPVVVEPCEPLGLLKALVQIRLDGSDERAARRLLIEGLSMARAKPATVPRFPGMRASREAPPFPGAPADRLQGTSFAMPKVRRASTDLEKRKFAKRAFETIKDGFRTALAQLGARYPEMEIMFQAEADELTVEIFLKGRSAAACKVWLGDGFGANSICYVEGRREFKSNACNEILMLNDEAGGLVLSATMDMGLGRVHAKLDTKHLSPDQAAQYLWHRLLQRLE